jgi:hypothetical protein
MGLLNRYTAITRIVGSNPIPSATSAYRVNRVLLGTGSPLAIDDPGRRGRVLNRSGTVCVLRQVPSGHSNQ